MSELVVIVLSICGTSLGIGLLSWWVGSRHHGWSRRTGLQAVGVCLGLGAVISGLALFAEWSPPSQPIFRQTVKLSLDRNAKPKTSTATFKIPMLAPNRPHIVYITPEAGFARSARASVNLRLETRSPEGRLLSQRSIEFPLYKRALRNGGIRTVWKTQSVTLKPKTPGTYSLKLISLRQRVIQIKVIVTLEKQSSS